MSLALGRLVHNSLVQQEMGSVGVDDVEKVFPEGQVGLGEEGDEELPGAGQGGGEGVRVDALAVYGVVGRGDAVASRPEDPKTWTPVPGAEVQKWVR